MWPFYIKKHRQEECIEEVNAAVTASGFELDTSYFPTEAVKSKIADGFDRFLDIFRELPELSDMRPVYVRTSPNHGKRNHAFKNLMQLKKKGIDYTIDVLVTGGNEIIHPPHLRQEGIPECDIPECDNDSISSYLCQLKEYGFERSPVCIGNYILVGLSRNRDDKLDKLDKLTHTEWLDEVQHYAKDVSAEAEKEDRIWSEIYDFEFKKVDEAIKNKLEEEEIEEIRKNSWESIRLAGENRKKRVPYKTDCRDYLEQYKLWKDCEPMECPNCQNGMTTKKYGYEIQGEGNGQPRDFEECEWCGGTGTLSDRTQIESYHLRELENIAKKLTKPVVEELIKSLPIYFGVYVKFSTKD